MFISGIYMNHKLYYAPLILPLGDGWNVPFFGCLIFGTFRFLDNQMRTGLQVFVGLTHKIFLASF